MRRCGCTLLPTTRLWEKFPGGCGKKGEGVGRMQARKNNSRLEQRRIRRPRLPIRGGIVVRQPGHVGTGMCREVAMVASHCAQCARNSSVRHA
jgi:hypothetical protein